jgi:hypothetical protein
VSDIRTQASISLPYRTIEQQFQRMLNDYKGNARSRSNLAAMLLGDSLEKVCVKSPPPPTANTQNVELKLALTMGYPQATFRQI